MTVVNARECYINSNCYANCNNITSIDLKNTPWVNNSMISAFNNCTSITSVTNINNNITDMCHTFWNCYSLVNAPVIPNSVTNMLQTFWNCQNLSETPNIPNSVTNMYGTFYNCYKIVEAPIIPNGVDNLFATFSECINLVNAPTIPNSVTNMCCTFAGCHSLVTAPIIPPNVTTVGWTAATIPGTINGCFRNCDNLRGDICILAENINRAACCFWNTDTYNKYVWIKPNTLTWNTFINAGYDTNGTQNKVFMREWDGTFSNLTVNVTPNTAIVNIVDVNEASSSTYNIYYNFNKQLVGASNVYTPGLTIDIYNSSTGSIYNTVYINSVVINQKTLIAQDIPPGHYFGVCIDSVPHFGKTLSINGVSVSTDYTEASPCSSFYNDPPGFGDGAVAPYIIDGDITIVSNV